MCETEKDLNEGRKSWNRVLQERVLKPGKKDSRSKTMLYYLTDVTIIYNIVGKNVCFEQLIHGKLQKQYLINKYDKFMSVYAS